MDYTYVKHVSPWGISGITTGPEILGYISKGQQSMANMWSVPVEKVKHTEILWDGGYIATVFYVEGGE